MPLFSEKWPYSNFHELNLDWILDKVKTLQKNFDTLKSEITPKYAGIWAITEQYQAGDVVTDDGIVYYALQAVPANTRITDPSYWVALTLEDSREITPYITVAKANGQYSTINEAIAAAKDYISTYGGRVTIYVMPGTYEENIQLLANPGIDIIGAGPEDTQICNITGTYPAAALHTTGPGYFANIFFNNILSDSYAVHIEAQEDKTAGDIVFENCRFQAASQAGVGAGLGFGVNAVFNNCDFRSIGNYSFYGHNYPGTATDSTLRITNSRFYKPIILDNARTFQGLSGSSPLICDFVNNGGTTDLTIRQSQTASMSYLGQGSDPDLTLTTTSNGNSFNANYIQNYFFSCDAYVGGAGAVVPLPAVFYQPNVSNISAISIGGTGELTLTGQAHSILVVNGGTSRTDGWWRLTGTLSQ